MGDGLKFRHQSNKVSDYDFVTEIVVWTNNVGPKTFHAT